MANKRGSGVKNRGRKGINASGPQQQNVRGSGARNAPLPVPATEDISPEKVNPPPKITTTADSKTPKPASKPPRPTVNKQKIRKSSKFGSLRYPNKEIHKNTDYLQIDVLQYKPLGLVLGKERSNTIRSLKTSKGNYNKKEDILGSILLPIPQNITSTNSTGWGEDSINPFAAYGLGLASEVINSENFFKGLINAGSQIFSDAGSLVQSGEAQQLSNAFFASKAVNLLGGNTSFEGVLARSTGQILNPNKELLFNGVKLRSFNFSFNLAPRNGDEAEMVKNIIRTLKISMSPSTTIENGNQTGIFLQSPNVFRLKYKTGSNNHQFLNSFVIAALTNVQVNYTGSGTYMTYDDGSKTPVHMVMQLSFQELSPVYAEDYDTESGKTGVGF
tara:strand:+ start:55 stop:1218 length:1164 start_codon:yes stop_codon:yes gene_type:complete